MPRTLDSSLPLKGFGPSKDGQGFGKIARQRQAVMDHVGGLPEHLLPILPPPEDLEAVEQLIKKSSNVEKRRRRRKQSRDSADSESGDSARKRVGRSKSTPLLDGPGGGSHAGKGANGGGASPEKPRRRRHRTPEPEPLTRRQFEVACEALHLPAVPGAQPKPGQPAAGVWFDRLGSSDKMAMRRVLERNGARAAIIVAELPEPTEKSVQKRVQKRVSAEKDAFQVVLERNRRVRSENGRVSNGRSRRSRLLDTGSSFGSSEEDSLDEELNSTLFRTEPKLKPLSEGEKLNLLDETPVTRAEPNQLWVGHIPDDAAKSGKDHLEERLRKLCRNYGQITDVAAHPRFDDLDCSRPDDQSWAIVTFKPGTMLHFMEILRAEVRMGDKLLVLQLAKEEIVEQFAESSGSLKRSDGMKQVDFALSPRHTLEEEMENYTRAHTQIHNHKMDVLDEELPDIGEEDRESGGLANEAAAPAEAIVQWISRIESLMEAKNYTLSLPGYGMGDGGSAALVTAIATIEQLNMDDLEHHEEVPQPSHIFRKLILSSNSLSPTDEQTAAAVADNHIGNGGSPGKLSVGKLSAKIQHTKLHGGTTKPQQLDGDSDADQEAPPDFDAQARELRKIKNRRTLQRRQAVHRIQRAYRKATGKTLNAGVSLFEKDALEVNSAPKSSGCDNIGMLLSLYVADIRKLDLSDNPLGIAGGRIIAEALDGHCPVKLKKLLLRDCKLTDQGAGAIIAVVLEQAPALTKLDLRKNGLGNDQRGDRGASAALHDLFVEGCCEVQSLKLGYNNLRPQHVRHFSPALREEKTLVYLDLAWNSLGDDGAMWLAHALRQNTTLLALDVTHNEIKEKGCFVIADMLKENRGLERIRLNENPIGERGARAILRTIRKLILYGWQREISVANCNMYYTSKDQIFDPQEAGGFHSCNLADPYQRSVAWGLVELAWDEDGENWIGETHDGKPYDLDEPPPGEIWTREKFQLPITGELSLTYFSTMRVARYGDVIEDPMLHQLLILMTHKSVTDGGVKLLKLAALEFFFTASMVGNLISLMKDSVSRAEVACALLPRIVDPVNVIAETYDVLTDGELATMEKNMGKLFHFNPVNPTGHYTLQLANSFDRVLIRRLAEITEEQGSLRREQELLDTSQKGDWDNFRNETLNGRPFDFDVEILSAGGMTAGVLEFDFVSTDSNHRQALLPPMPDDVFELFLDELWQTRNKVKLPVAEGISNREGGTILVEQPFSIRFPEAEYALRKQRDERTETDIQAILSMLKKLEFPIKALAAVQRMCAVASYKFVPAGENVITGGEKGDDIYVLLHGSLQVLGASYIEDASAKDNQGAPWFSYPRRAIRHL
jgi:Ran GTPase-activating protein (RanGAP) involved in mRNA processing and transport